LSSPNVDVAVILDEAILVAGTERDSRSPVLINPIKVREKREVSLFDIPLSPRLAEKEDLPTLVKSEINVDITSTEEHL
jgi:hypothetical protein